MILKFSQLPRPLIVGSVRQATIDEAISEIRSEEAAGARAFIVHLQLLKAEHRDFISLKKIAAASEYPMMAIHYRTEGGPDDEQRIETLREAVQAGFSSVDIPMYLYDSDSQSSLDFCDLPFATARPKEVSMRPQVIDRQTSLIKEFQKMGAEVLLSAHVGVELSCEQTVSLGLEIQSRGANIVKIISSCESKEQTLEILRTNLKLQDTLKVPFLYTCYGTYNRFIRFNAPLFGSMLVFGHQQYTTLSNCEKPLISDLVSFYERGIMINEGNDH